jgi:hypothetical protein
VVAYTVPVPSSDPEVNVAVACPDESVTEDAGEIEDPLGGFIPPTKLHEIVNPDADIFSYAAFLICAVRVLDENVVIVDVPEIEMLYGLLFIVRFIAEETGLRIKLLLAYILKLYVRPGRNVDVPMPPAEKVVALAAMLSDRIAHVESVFNLYSILYPVTVVQFAVAAVQEKLANIP